MRSGIAPSFLIPAHLGYSLLLVTSYRVSRCFSYPLVPSDRSIKQDSLLPSFDSAGSIAADSWNGDSLFRFPRTFLFFFLSFLRPNCTLLARSKLRIYRSWYQHQITDVSLFEKPDISICILSAVCYEECAPLNESSYHCVAKMFTVGFSISKFLAFFLFFFFFVRSKE